MKKNSRLLKLAKRFLPAVHGHYQEMCSLAATGQLGGPQMSELNSHIATCDCCREFLESVVQVSMEVMPVLAESRVSAVDIAPPQGMRARFLSRIATEEWGRREGVTPVPIVVQKPFPEALRIHQAGRTGADVSALRNALVRLSLNWQSAAILAACAFIGVIGFFAGHRTSTQTYPRVTQPHPSGAAIHGLGTSTDGPDRLILLAEEKKDLESRLGELKEKLSTSQAQEKILGKKVADASNNLTALTAVNENERQRLAQENQQAKSQVAYLQSEVEKLRWQVEDVKAKLSAQQNESEQLRAKLELTESDRQRELELKSAKSDMGDLIAARNLHIVDVYDADPDGKRQRSFGRVFYIEGKSLVFYAYDLEGPGRFKANVVFHVWGGKAGVKEVTHSLGVLRKEDAGQSRWAATFDDPRVLAQINSVFVTAESANKHYDEPHGKKVLYAYFGSQPNHP